MTSRNGRSWVVGTLLVATAVTALALVASAGLDALGLRFGPLGKQVDAPGPRPAFALPFGCGERWRLSTYRGHNPEDMKLDLFRMDGQTRGSAVRASAPGTVVRLVTPGGVKIDHGGRWQTLYLHMDGIEVEPGQEVARGQRIGRVGSVGTQAAHLHYEQLFDDNGDGWARTSEMVHPVIQGTEYRLRAGADWPVLTSTNGC